MAATLPTPMALATIAEITNMYATTGPARPGSGPARTPRRMRGAEDREHGHHDDDPDEERGASTPSTCMPTM